MAGDEYLDSDVVFGVKDSLIREFKRCSAGRAPDGRMLDRDFFHLNYDFGLKQITSSGPGRLSRERVKADRQESGSAN